MDSSRFILLFIVYLSGTCTCAGGCRNGWTQFGSSCYFFSTHLQTWLEAFLTCKNLFTPAHLVEVTDSHEENFLRTQTGKLGGQYWIGASDQEVENEWRWVTSDTLLEYTDWAPSEPDDVHDQDCAFLHGGPWDDIGCDNRKLYICESDNAASAIVG